MVFFADLHVHSKYSRATSKSSDLIELAKWAALKGIKVLVTGDFTHPQWSAEIKETLVESDNQGLYQLKPQHVPEMEPALNGFGPADVRFMLNVEISSIYKKNGAVRKVHNLVFMPDLDSMERFNSRLDRIGNIRSDGRPILGLDSRHLLEIALETTDESFVVPAHVWTPWFSILGSKSGFDSVDECFDDLTPHIFALETGLSSDPEMNRRISSLDRYTLISNSDIHSPSRLGREANIFDGIAGYVAIREAIRHGNKPPSASYGSHETKFLGTIEYFPEEGKYHLDGHRKCSSRMDPEDTHRLDGICPICGRSVTVGVMNRVMELADRPPGTMPEYSAPFRRLLPLQEMVAQILDVGVQSKKVEEIYFDILRKFGPELNVLSELSLDDPPAGAPDIFVQALKKVREGELTIEAGYDGEYGTVRLFGPGERERLGGQESLLGHDRTVLRRRTVRGPAKKRTPKQSSAAIQGKGKASTEDNPEQEECLKVWDRLVMVEAGPGTGKTRTLIARIAAALENAADESAPITAVTFTRKAAQEIKNRLEGFSPEKIEKCWIGTFHQLGSRLIELLALEDVVMPPERVLSEDESWEIFLKSAKCLLSMSTREYRGSFEQIGMLKQNLLLPEECADTALRSLYVGYEDALMTLNYCDFDDLISIPAKALQSRPELCRRIRSAMCTHLLVDEFQDINKAQYELCRVLSPENGAGVFAIGDPDQAVYGFRGADKKYFGEFAASFSDTCRIRLRKNYRSQISVLECSAAVIGGDRRLVSVRAGRVPVKIVKLPSPAAEAEFIVATIDAALGGSSFFSMDARNVSGNDSSYSLKDFAVLFRLNAIGDMLEERFMKAGIPFQRVRKTDPREETEGLDPRAEAVSMMTMHASKGLEFPFVFIAGCEDGIVPFTPLSETGMSADPEEEKRLLYVAMTRARDQLYITHCGGRMLYGAAIKGQQSRFLTDLKSPFCERSARVKKKTTKLIQRDLFAD